MPFDTADYISFPGCAEGGRDTNIEEDIAADEEQHSECSLKGDGSKWVEKFCRKFLDHLNMRSLIASLTLSVLVINFNAICRSYDRLSQRESAPPKPFFPFSSRKYLIDYYTGNDAEPSKLSQLSEIVIVMYYAPWSRRCSRTRVVFEKVAKSFSESSDISFGAVNCFYLYGGCRKSYRTHTYPVIAAYVGGQSLMYTGILASDYIYRWISRLRNPIRRLVTEYDLKNFFNEYDNTVVAFFEEERAFDVSHDFLQYLKAALIVFQRLFAEDFLDRIGFGIVTNSGLAMGVSSAPKTWIQLRTWNHAVKYNGFNVSAVEISEWIRDQVNSWSGNGLQWVIPEMNGVAKSEQLLSVLQSGPTVMVFLDQQVLYPHSWAVTVTEETIMEYYACGSGAVDEMKLRISKREEVAEQRNHLIAMNSHKCQEINAYAREIRKCCLTEKASLRSYCFHCRYRNEDTNFLKDGSCDQHPPFMYSTYSSLFHNAPCISALSMQNEEKLLSDCCALMISKSKQVDVAQEAFEQCAKYRLARDIYGRISRSPPSEPYLFDNTSIAGLSCGKNNSLRFIGIDARYGDYVLERIRKPYDGKPIALIADPHNERTYLMETNFSRQAFRDFLRSFHNGSLISYSVSQARKTEDVTHLDHNLSVISSTTAKSIDVSLNELPWQFQMEALPTILLFPAKRKASSSHFPALVPLTAPNLIAFIVTKCQKELRWRLASSLSSFLCKMKNTLRLRRVAISVRNDITSLRWLALSNIRYSHLFQHLIRRRAKQIRVTRRLLKIISRSGSFDVN